MRDRRGGRTTRCPRHSRPGRVLGYARAVHANGRGIPARVQHHEQTELRGDLDLPATDFEGEG